MAEKGPAETPFQDCHSCSQSMTPGHRGVVWKEKYQNLCSKKCSFFLKINLASTVENLKWLMKQWWFTDVSHPVQYTMHTEALPYLHRLGTRILCDFQLICQELSVQWNGRLAWLCENKHRWVFPNQNTSLEGHLETKIKAEIMLFLKKEKKCRLQYYWINNGNNNTCLHS